MTIRRTRTKPERARITTYDLEWRRESLKLTLCGAYDERGYRPYLTAKEFLRGELVPGNSGRRYYAHYGGGADMVFLLRELARLPNDFRITGAYSGSAAIVVRVQRGEHSWLFLDSFWTMRAKLADIGAWLGLPKLDEKSTDDMTFAELLTYNERDCEILYVAMNRFQEAILEVGGELGITIASTALKTFLRKYMGKPIENGPALDEYVSLGYTASRVERFRPSCEAANYYDLNSSFAYSMCGSIPGSLERFELARPGLSLPDAGLWFADVTVSVDDDYPALPFKSESGRIFYPNGRFRTKISSEDYMSGGFRVERLHSLMTFEERDDMRAYAEDFYRLRLQSGFEGKVYKFALTNLYGKFSEHPDKVVLIINPEDNDYSGETEILAPGVTIAKETKEVKHRHVPISAIITARSRRYLLERIRFAAKRGRVYYSDTDSVICDAALPTCDVPGDHSECEQGSCRILGGLKREFVVRRGKFVAPKLYALEKEPGTYPAKDAPQEVKAKGFSRAVGILSPEEWERLPKRAEEREAELRQRVKERVLAPDEGERVPLTYDVFTQLSEGSAAVIERFCRSRELLNKYGPDYEPRTVMFAKGINSDLRPKRRPTADGGSEPWDVREIADE